MSEPFIIAAKLHLTRDEYHAWLASKTPAAESIADWESMYAGWYWPDKEPTVDFITGERSVAQSLADIIGYVKMGTPYVALMKYDETHAVFRLYVMSVVGQDPGTAALLFCLLRNAARFKTSKIPDAVLYWPEMSGTINFEGMLSVAYVGNGTSAFVDRQKMNAFGLHAKQITKEYKDLERWYRHYLNEMLDNGDDCTPTPTTWKKAEYIDANFLSLLAGENSSP